MNALAAAFDNVSFSAWNAVSTLVDHWIGALLFNFRPSDSWFSGICSFAALAVYFRFRSLSYPRTCGAARRYLVSDNLVFLLSSRQAFRFFPVYYISKESNFQLREYILGRSKSYFRSSRCSVSSWEATRMSRYAERKSRAPLRRPMNLWYVCAALFSLNDIIVYSNKTKGVVTAVLFTGLTDIWWYAGTRSVVKTYSSRRAFA